jgi:hypothetical protein
VPDVVGHLDDDVVPSTSIGMDAPRSTVSPRRTRRSSAPPVLRSSAARRAPPREPPPWRRRPSARGVEDGVERPPVGGVEPRRELPSQANRHPPSWDRFRPRASAWARRRDLQLRVRDDHGVAVQQQADRQAPRRPSWRAAGPRRPSR